MSQRVILYADERTIDGAYLLNRLTSLYGYLAVSHIPTGGEVPRATIGGKSHVGSEAILAAVNDIKGKNR